MALLVGLLIATSGQPLHALTPAGTRVTNTAVASYDGGAVQSNVVEFTVAQVAGVEVVPAVASSSGEPGETLYYPVIVTNAGNGEDPLDLSASSDADWPSLVIRDDNADGARQASETTAVTSTGALPAESQFLCFVAVTIPEGAVGGATTVLTATSSFDPAVSASAICYSQVVPSSGPLAADFFAWPTDGEAPLSVDFTDLSAGSPLSWQWEFGDGSTSTEQSPSHEYSTPGTYTVSLTVANADGMDTETKVGLIDVTSTGPASVVDFTAAPRSGAAPLSVTFTAWCLEADGTATWAWDFGDGETGTEQNPVHTYAAPGSYTVSVTVTTAVGSWTKTKQGYVLVGFSDVAGDHWAHDEIMACLRAGTVEGYPDGKYHPEVRVSREQMAVFAVRAVTLPTGEASVPDGPVEASFPDVPTDYWAYKYVEYAKHMQIILGYPDGLYHPDYGVSRGQMAVFIARSVVDPTGDDGLADYWPPATPSFPDVTQENEWSWCYEHVEYIASQGIASGYPEGTYNPERTCSRDQMAVFIARAFELPM